MKAQPGKEDPSLPWGTASACPAFRELEHWERRRKRILWSALSPPENTLSPPEVTHCINKVILISRSHMQNFTHGAAMTFNLVPSAQQADYFNYRVGLGFFFSFPHCSFIVSFSHITEKLRVRRGPWQHPTLLCNQELVTWLSTTPWALGEVPSQPPNHRSSPRLEHLRLSTGQLALIAHKTSPLTPGLGAGLLASTKDEKNLTFASQINPNTAFLRNPTQQPTLF